MTEPKRFELRADMLPRLTEAFRESLVAGRITRDEAEDWCNATYDALLEYRVQAGTKKGADGPHSPPTPNIPNG